MIGNRTQNVAMHQWVLSTTALEAEGNWIVTLTVHDHTQTQPIPISEWRGRGGGEEWVVFVGVEGAERELVMVYLCLYWFCFFLCLWYCTWCVFLWFWLFRWLCYRVVWEVNSDPSWSSWYLLSTMNNGCFLWSHRLQWNISCTLWVPWIHRMGWITASVIWNHGLQREAGIEAVGVCFNGCEWECVWMSGLLIIWNGNKRWVLMEWRGMCHDEISIANR